MSKWVLISGRYYNTDQIVSFQWSKKTAALRMMLPDGREVSIGDPHRTWYEILRRAVGVNGG